MAHSPDYFFKEYGITDQSPLSLLQLDPADRAVLKIAGNVVTDLIAFIQINYIQIIYHVDCIMICKYIYICYCSVYDNVFR